MFVESCDAGRDVISVKIVGLVALQPSTMAPVTHVVIFQYKSSTTVEEKQNVASSFLALQERCLSPANPGFASPGKPYIVSIIGGSNNSLEPKAAGYEHVYVVTFASPEHRDYYVGLDPEYADPAHTAFKKLVGPLLVVERIAVADFTDGEWSDK